MAESRFLADVADEIERARAKFRGDRHRLAALGEEAGELSRAMLEHHHGKLDAEQVYREAVQVATMAARVATEGDADFAFSGFTRCDTMPSHENRR